MAGHSRDFHQVDPLSKGGAEGAEWHLHGVGADDRRSLCLLFSLEPGESQPLRSFVAE